MSITHDEARRLIQFRADDALRILTIIYWRPISVPVRNVKNMHPPLHDLEATLQHLMQRRWDRQPLPLPAGKPVPVNSSRFTQSIFFATRIIAMGIICVAFLFNIWQFTQPGAQRATPPAAEIPLIPTPSMQTPGTSATDQTCESIYYEVKGKRYDREYRCSIFRPCRGDPYCKRIENRASPIPP